VPLPVMPPSFWVVSTKPEAGMYRWMGHKRLWRSGPGTMAAG